MSRVVGFRSVSDVCSTTGLVAECMCICGLESCTFRQRHSNSEVYCTQFSRYQGTIQGTSTYRVGVMCDLKPDIQRPCSI